MNIWFDHLVVGAADLAQGAAWTKQAFGAEVPVGGAHPAMGTHNRIMRLATGYLEVIAVDPAAAEPLRRRWYGLDDADQRARLVERPRPIAFVMATDDLEAAVAAAGWEVGEIVHASRGDLTWRMALREDGAAAEGVLPPLIEWPASIGRRAPTDRMADFGFALRSLRLKHPEPDRIRMLLRSLKIEDAMHSIGAPIELTQDDDVSLEAMIAPSRIDARR